MIDRRHRYENDPTAWCILRTNGAQTQLLAKSLTAAGFDVWTPVETRRRRKARSKTMVEIDMPMMPTFVFVRADRAADLARARLDPRTPHPKFSLFHYLGTVPCVSDAEVERLRTAERRQAPKGRRQVFAAGTTVRVPEGPFGGMSGVVKQGNDKFTLVAFDGRMEVKISTFLLLPDEVRNGNEQDAARAAKAS